MTSETRGDELRRRPAKPGDYPFAVGLYLDGAERYLSKIGRWSRPRIAAKFRRGYKPAYACVLSLRGEDVGWMQVVELSAVCTCSSFISSSHTADGVWARA